MIRSLSAAALLAAVLVVPAIADPVTEAIAAGAAQGHVAGAPIAARKVVPEFYAIRGNRPAWFGRAEDTALSAGLQDGLEQGLLAADLHLPLLDDLRRAAEASGTPADIAAYDVLATDAAIRLVYLTVFGKVDPQALDPDWNFARPALPQEPEAGLNIALQEGGFGALLDEIAPTNHQYRDLITALARYRAIDAAGGWPELSEGPTLKPGMRDPRVVELRARLAAEGGQLSPDLDPELYDPALELAVQRFQTRHGLEADGAVGPRSLTALNRSAAHRANQIRASLERLRWYQRDLPADFVLVNIAAPRTYLVRDGAMVWSTRAITGSAYRKTPVFFDEIEYIEVNPTWTVPNSIFRKDKLARIRRDPGYLARGGYSVRRTSDGAALSPSQVNWSASNPGVTLVQKPGENNALGRIKFMFPNQFAVYLHDTNDRSLFERNERNLSSGCVRIENPYDFADLLMADDPTWNRAKLDALLATGKTTRVPLPAPMPVMLTYWTAWVQGGEVQFREDIYERDGRLLAALDAPLR